MSEISSKLGFGTWQFGGANKVNGRPTGWGDVNEDEAIAAIHYALDKGIVFFDTADTYGRGQSERVLGEAFKTYKGAAKPIICTKFGNRESSPDVFVKDYSADYLYECVNESLARLGVEKLDVLLLHSPDDTFDWEGYSSEPYERLVRAGKISAYGVSSRSVYGARKVVEHRWGSVIELTYNLLDRRAEQELFAHPEFLRYSFIARVPLASGFLNSRYLTEDPAFSEDDYRSLMSPNDREWLVASVRKLAFLEQQPGGLSGAALRFLLFSPFVSYVIPGMRSVANVTSNIKALELGPLSPEVIREIEHSVPDVPDAWKPKKSS
jgi:aryl-alcohol dehydrogenase-like predicted oxidoreductase